MRAVAGRRLATVKGRLDPEFREGTAIGHGTRMLHQATDAKGPQDGVIEACGALEVVCADGNMGQDAGHLF